jgi:hypothetical protein
VPRMWIGPVNSRAPDGTFVSWDALWMEEAESISLDSLLFGPGIDVVTNQERIVDRELVKSILFDKCASGPFDPGAP